MRKSYKVEARLTADEMQELERAARALRMSKSEYVRAALSGVFAPSAAASTPVDLSKIDGLASDIESLKSALDEIRAEMQEAAKAHVALAERIAELTRVPTFREYRSRALAEGIEQRPGESETSYLTRLAVRYFAMYGRWPDPSEKRKFGAVGAGFDLQKWPTEPPK